MHLTEFGLKNFRVFKEFHNLELAPISLLTGPNGSGKSSLIKALLLLKDSGKGKSYFNPLEGFFEFGEYPHNIFDLIPLELNFNNKSKHYINDFSNALNRESGDSDLQFTFPFVFPELKRNNIGKIELIYAEFTERPRIKELSISIDKINIFSVRFKYSKDDTISVKYSININYLAKSFENDNIVFKTELNTEELKSPIFERLPDYSLVEDDLIINTSFRSSQNEAAYESSLKDFGIFRYPFRAKQPYGNRIFGLYFNNLIEEKKFFIENPELFSSFLDIEEQFLREYTDSKRKISYTRILVYGQSDSVCRSLDNEIVSFIEEKKLLNETNKPENSNNSANTLFLTQYGLFLGGMIDRAVAYNFSQYQDILNSIVYIPNPNIRFENLITEDTPELYRLITGFNRISIIDEERRKEQSFYPPYNFIKILLKELDIGDSIEFEKVKSYGFEIFVNNGGYKIPIKDLGFGIRKLISIVLNIIVAADKNQDGDGDLDWYEPSIIILEEPESNLHPKLQSFLADILFIAASIFNVQFIIETHSEYLVRKFQYIVASTINKNNRLEAKHIVVHYFRNPSGLKEGEEQVYELGMRPDGILKRDFGPGFFDESLRLTSELLKIQSQN